MSRSHRAPVWTQGYGGLGRKAAKRQASRAVRTAGEVPDGKAYRRYYNPWDICDFRFYEKRPEKPWKVRGK